MKVDGKMIINQVLEFIHINKQVRNMKESGNKVRKMDKESLLFKMVIFIQVDFKIILNKDKEK